MAALLALSAAVTYGVSDFLGGIAARRQPPTAVVLWSHVIGLFLMLALAPLVAGMLTSHGMAVGAGAGLLGALGVTLYYQAFALGNMSVVAPVAALLSAGVPVLVGLGAGDRPSTGALLGIGIALFAVVLISRDGTRPDTSLTTHPQVKAVAYAVASGAAFGGFFTVLDAAPADAGLWPLVGARLASITLFATLGVAGVVAAAPPRTALMVALGAGALDSLANAFYLVALSHGMLSVVAVLSALYPASTLLLARWVLGERMVGIQRVGLGLAAGAAILLAL
jgi:drug/metabolite transporter (DMT)-like permease